MSDDTYDIKPLPWQNCHQVLRPTVLLRWNKGVLEQQWQIEDYEDGNIKSISQEWKPIPEAD